MRIDQCVSVIRAVELPVLVCLLSSCETVKRVMLALKSSYKMTGTLWILIHHTEKQGEWQVIYAHTEVLYKKNIGTSKTS